MSIRVSGTHFQGPILGSDRSGGGLWDDQPIECANAPRSSVLFLDFLSQFDEDELTLTAITSGTGDLIADVANGIYRLSNTVANQGIGSLQFANADNASEGVAAPAAGEVVSFEARVTMADWSDSDWFIGLGETDTTFMDATGVLLANGADNHAGWHHLVADAGVPDLSVAGTALANQEDVTQYARSVGTAVNPLVALTYYRFGMRIEGVDRVRFYIDGVPISDWHAMGTNFADGLVPTFTLISNGTAELMDIDYILVARTR